MCVYLPSGKMKTPKSLKISVLLLTLFLVFSAFSVLNEAQTLNKPYPASPVGPQDAADAGDYTVDPIPYLHSLGYTDQELQNMTKQQFVRALLGNPEEPTMEEICMNLFGNTTGYLP
jgi:hypothetical protein